MNFKLLLVNLFAMQLAFFNPANAEMKLTKWEFLTLITVGPTASTVAGISNSAHKKTINKKDAMDIQEDLAIYDATKVLSSELESYSKTVMQVRNVGLEESLDILDDVSLYVLEQ